MAEKTIVVESGVSWLHDNMRSRLEERALFLQEWCGKGLPYHEYIGFVGRLKECRRQIDELAELFKDFYQSEDTEDEELEELNG